MQKYSDTHSNYAPLPRQQLRDVGEGLALAGEYLRQPQRSASRVGLIPWSRIDLT